MEGLLLMSAILARMKKTEGAGIAPPEYLLRHEDALLSEGEWEWVPERARAYRFASHKEAERAIPEHWDGKDAWLKPWACVCGAEEVAMRAEVARVLCGKAVAPVAGRRLRRRPDPSEVYRETAARLGEHEQEA